MKWYISLCNRVISIKTKKTSLISQTGSIGQANFNLKTNVIINLPIYFEFILKLFLDEKGVLYMAKRSVGL